MTERLFSDEALAAQLHKQPDIPAETVSVGVVANKDDVGAEIIANKTIGKGWFVEGEGSWWKQKGWQAAAWLGWSKK